MFERFFKKTEKQQKTVGALGEEVAETFLRKNGFLILGRNYRNRRGVQLGELDIIAEENGTVVFVEVKSRKCQSTDIMLPEENITFEKLRKLSKIAELWLREQKRLDGPYRFDAVSVTFCGLRDPEIRHLRNIFL